MNKVKSMGGMGVVLYGKVLREEWCGRELVRDVRGGRGRGAR